MTTRKFAAGIAAIALSLGTITAPQVLAQEPGTEPVTDEEIQEGLKDMSFQSSDGTEILPGETITLTADTVAEGVEIRNAYVELSPGYSTTKWDVDKGVNEEGLPTLTITAPDAPEEQTGEIMDYGEYLVHIRTSNWNSAYFTINFVEEKTPEPVAPSSSAALEELSSAFQRSSF